MSHARTGANSVTTTDRLENLPPDSLDLPSEYSRWLQEFDWDHFLTLTFDTPVSLDTAMSRFECGYVRHLERRGQRPVDYFGAVGRGTVGGQTHIHAVLAGTGPMSCATVERAWQGGFAHAELFDAEDRGLAYIAKHLEESESRLVVRNRRA